MASAAGAVLALDAGPMGWLGGAAAGLAADGWKAAMVGLWSAGLWLLQLAFTLIDAFTSPDVSGSGPLAGALPTTLWLGGAVAVLLLCVQLLSALLRRDGAGLGRLLLGLVQFGVVWTAFLGVDGVMVTAAGALARGLLASLLHVGSWSQVTVAAGWPRQVDDATAATVLGISSLLLLIPASFTYLLLMLVREAALVVLLATTPVSSAGLLSDTTRAWFWKSLRWFVACLLVAPAAALVLGIGVSLSNGVVSGAGTDTVAAAGTAVVGCVLVLVGAVCPIALFRLLAFVDPATQAGASLRQSLARSGGLSGVLRGLGGGSPARRPAGLLAGASGAGWAAAAASPAEIPGGGWPSTRFDPAGRAHGEATAEAGTAARMTAALHGLADAVGAGPGLVPAGPAPAVGAAGPQPIDRAWMPVAAAAAEDGPVPAVADRFATPLGARPAAPWSALAAPSAPGVPTVSGSTDAAPLARPVGPAPDRGGADPEPDPGAAPPAPASPWSPVGPPAVASAPGSAWSPSWTPGPPGLAPAVPPERQAGAVGAVGAMGGVGGVGGVGGAASGWPTTGSTGSGPGRAGGAGTVGPRAGAAERGEPGPASAQPW